ncbi:MAG: polysulfide reductase NrfD [Candidatus Krumholzibacteria bacterium]|nr:polysulfide reductase NrfD [Candidatus Krumholzibacteria bacterium]
MNYGFIIDNRKCIGCHACTVACKAEHETPVGVNRTWVKYIEKGEYPDTRRLFSVMRCNHCAEAPCVDICPTKALFTRTDGIVDFDNRRCIGCKSCMQACPYDALYIDPDTHTAAKCNYCAHREEIGLEPACVIVCPEHAIVSGNMDDPDSEISHLLDTQPVTVRKAEKGTEPKLFYINGDELSLNPALSRPSTSYMWSSQAAGVGHYARFAESRLITGSEVVRPTSESERVGRSRGQMGDVEPVADEEWMSASGTDERVLVPKGAEDAGMVNKAREVLDENVRRVYDVPDKGVMWGWPVAAYVWTKAISTGAFLVVFLPLALGFIAVDDATQWWGLWTALVFLFLTGFLLVKDLDQPRRFLYVLLRPQWKSWLVRGGYALLVYSALLSLMVASEVFDWNTLQGPLRWLTAVFAIMTAIYTAFLFAQAKGRDLWQSRWASLHMVVQSLAAGAAVGMVIAMVPSSAPEWESFLRMLLPGAVIFNLFLTVIELFGTHATQDARRTMNMIVAGRFRIWSWAGGVVAGHVVPLLILWTAAAELWPLAGVLVLVGIYIMDHIWVRAPQLVPLS